MNSTIIGYAPYHIPIYKNSAFFEKNAILHIGKKGTKYAGLVYGIKYQCVELVRRWLIHSRNVTFSAVDNATAIFKLKYANDINANDINANDITKNVNDINANDINVNDINANDITKNVNDINVKIPFIHIKNDGIKTPLVGDIIIWKQQGQYKKYGHCAIVSKIISPSLVTIAEQNGTGTGTGIRNIQVHKDSVLGWMRI